MATSRPELSLQRRRAVGSVLLLATWAAVWSLAWRGSAWQTRRRMHLPPVTPKRVDPPAPPRRALGVWPRRLVIALAVAGLSVLASVSLRLSPATATLFAAAGLLAIVLAVVAERLVRAPDDVAGVASLPDPSVPDVDAIAGLLRMLDRHRRFPADIRVSIFTEVERLREAPPAHQRAVRIELQT